MTIAVTGLFASGKSTLVNALSGLGAESVSADGLVHDLLASDETTVNKVASRFGEGVRGERGIDRGELGKMVFGEPGALEELEEMLHPEVRREIQRLISQSRAALFVAEVPLLFEAGFEAEFDLTVAVVAPEERRRGWAVERGLDEDALAAIEARQLSGEEKARGADLIVENDGTPAKLRGNAKELKDRILGA